MEVLQAREAILHEVVAVHAGKQDAVVAAAVEVDVADGIGMVERARNLDGVVDITRDGLVGEGERRDVLHAGADRVDAHVDAPLPREADRAIDVPRLLAVLDERELVDRDAVEAAASRELQAVVRLLEERAVRRGELEVHHRISDIALCRALKVAEARDIGLRDQRPHEREVDMAAVEGEVDLAAALDFALDAKARAMRQVEARVVDRDIRALREERGREALDRQALVRTSLQGGAAVRLQIACIRARAGKAHVEGDTAREVRELRDVRSRLLRVDIAADEVRRIRQAARQERTLAAHCAAESADRDILHRDAPAFIADVCARIREQDAIGLTGGDADITVDDGILHRPRDGRLERRRALIGDITEHLGRVKGARGDAKVEIRGIRVVADLAADVRLLTIRVSIGREQRLRIREGDEPVDVVDWRLLDRDGAALVFCLPREGELAAHVLARDLCLLHCAAANLDAVRDCPLRQQWQDVHEVES